MGLVCFRLRSDGDHLTSELLASLNRSGKIHMVPARVQGLYVIRYLVASQRTTDSDIGESSSLARLVVWLRTWHKYMCLTKFACY